MPPAARSGNQLQGQKRAAVNRHTFKMSQLYPPLTSERAARSPTPVNPAGFEPRIPRVPDSGPAVPCVSFPRLTCELAPRCLLGPECPRHGAVSVPCSTPVAGSTSCHLRYPLRRSGPLPPWPPPSSSSSARTCPPVGCMCRWRRSRRMSKRRQRPISWAHTRRSLMDARRSSPPWPLWPASMLIRRVGACGRLWALSAHSRQSAHSRVQ